MCVTPLVYSLTALNKICTPYTFVSICSFCKASESAQSRVACSAIKSLPIADFYSVY